MILLLYFPPVSCGFYYYGSVVELEIRDGDTSRSSFIVQDSYLGFLFFRRKLSVVFSRSVKSRIAF